MRIAPDDETTLKRFYAEGTVVRLQPENSQMEPNHRTSRQGRCAEPRRGGVAVSRVAWTFLLEHPKSYRLSTACGIVILRAQPKNLTSVTHQPQPLHPRPFDFAQGDSGVLRLTAGYGHGSPGLTKR